MTWDLRPSIDDKQGTTIDQSAIKKTATSNSMEGEISIPISASPQVLSVRVLNNAVKRAWMLYRILEPNYPVNIYLTANGKFVASNYVKINTGVDACGRRRQQGNFLLRG